MSWHDQSVLMNLGTSSKLHAYWHTDIDKITPLCRNTFFDSSGIEAIWSENFFFFFSRKISLQTTWLIFVSTPPRQMDVNQLAQLLLSSLFDLWMNCLIWRFNNSIFSSWYLRTPYDSCMSSCLFAGSVPGPQCSVSSPPSASVSKWVWRGFM